MVRKNTIPAFTSGAHTKLDKGVIPKDAAATSVGWVTKDGHIELSYGRQAQGAEGSSGKVWAEHTGFKTDGTSVRFRKIWDGTEGKVQYLNGSTWTDIVTSLANATVTFTNYSSLAGNFVYIGSPDDGLFKIVTANPGDYSDVYDSTKNFKGYFLIDKARSILWGAENDSTGLYGSYIDSQDSDVYTTVSAEAIGSSGSTNYSGTLAFKSGGSTRSCFGVTFTDGTQTITIDFTGNATSASDGTGTVNFMTGAYNVTFTATTTGSVTSDYQWEDSNANGVTDFTKSATRLAGEGFVVRQDAGGDAIKTVIPYDGSYFSMKERSVYKFTLDVADTNPTNELIRTNIGVSSINAAVGTSAGIVFMNTNNSTEPELNILSRNPFGDNFTTEPLFAHFAFEDYTYTDVALENWDRFIVIACKDEKTENDTVLLCDIRTKIVDPISYDVRCFTKDDGLLYGGSPFNTTSYELFTGFDDMDQVVTNSWESSLDKFGSDTLKKTKRLRFGGEIALDQTVDVYLSKDNGDYQQVGTILGTGGYVDYSSSHAIGTTMIGNNTVGGDATVPVYRFLAELKIRVGKFRARQIKFVATGIGYVHFHMMEDHDVWLYQDKLPRNYRLKQNVSLDGATTNQDNPSY
jgi:hypothetical protein